MGWWAYCCCHRRAAHQLTASSSSTSGWQGAVQNPLWLQANTACSRWYLGGCCCIVHQGLCLYHGGCVCRAVVHLGNQKVDAVFLECVLCSLLASRQEVSSTVLLACSRHAGRATACTLCNGYCCLHGRSTLCVLCRPAVAQGTMFSACGAGELC
jgi:hypothetical protein